MKVKMLKTTKGSVNGISVQVYKQDETYELEGDLLNVFLDIKAAVPFEEEKMVTVPSNKAVVPEMNKTIKEEKEDEKKQDKKGSKK